MAQISSKLFSELREMHEAKTAPAAVTEHCDFCSETIPDDHRHFMDVSNAQVMCACQMCTILQAAGQRYKLIPQKITLLKDFNMTDKMWSDFLIPVNVAYFTYSSERNGVVAYYPAAAGAVESKLKIDSWNNLLEANPMLAKMHPDVEALLINRLGAEQTCYQVPVDKCYELAGTLKMNWKGIFGGREAQDALELFFSALNAKAHDAA